MTKFYNDAGELVAEDETPLNVGGVPGFGSASYSVDVFVPVPFSTHQVELDWEWSRRALR